MRGLIVTKNCIYTISKITKALNPDSITCVQELYGDDRRIWNGLFELFSRDLAEVASTGINLGSQQGKFFPIVLGNKGDWSYLDPYLHILFGIFSRALRDHRCVSYCRCMI